MLRHAGFVRCTEPTHNRWHFCLRHLNYRPKYQLCIIEEIADQSPVEQTPRAAEKLRKERREQNG